MNECTCTPFYRCAHCRYPAYTNVFDALRGAYEVFADTEEEDEAIVTEVTASEDEEDVFDITSLAPKPRPRLDQ